ncbi:MAG: type IV pilus assembly protein PilM [Candidatus Andersenbacteria bacterium]|nr:type IV pilus assembly protein PilM [Candidatus Andersenbacteria bacterium]
MVGIDISDKSIKIAEIAGKRRPQLKAVCWSPLPPNIMRRGVIQDVNLTVAALREAMVKCSPVAVEGNVAVVSIPETQSFVRVLELPAMPDHEVDEAVQWAVRQHIPFDLERVYLDWQPVQDNNLADGRRHVLVGAVQRDVVDPLLAVLDGAGLKVAALELEAQAIVRSILPTDSHDVRGVLIIDLGATSTNIIFFDQGVVRFTTSIQLGGDDLTKQVAHSLNIQPSIAAEQKALVGANVQSQSGVAVVLHESALALLSRVEKVVREIAAQALQEQPVKAILLSGGSANLPGIANVFAEVFPGIPIEMGNPFINMMGGTADRRAMPLSQADASHFVTAFGLALRQVETI